MCINSLCLNYNKEFEKNKTKQIADSTSLSGIPLSASYEIGAGDPNS